MDALGPGTGGLRWLYSYGAAKASWDTCSGCASSIALMVTDPDNNVTRYRFGNRFRVNEGQLLSVKTGLPAGTGETGGVPLRSVLTH